MSENEGGVASEILASQFGEQIVDDGNLEAQAAETQEETSTEHKEEKYDDGFDRKFAALSRKDKELREEREAFASQKEEMAALKAELEALKAPKEEAKEPELPLEYRLKRNPMETLAELGIDYETLTNIAINDGKMSPEMQMKLMQEDLHHSMDKKYGSKLEEIQAKLDAKEQAEREEREAAEERQKEEAVNKAVEDFTTKISSHIESEPEKYELVSANNAQDLIYDVIEEHYNDTGRILEIEEASDAVENYLMDEAKKLMKLKKLSGNSEPEIKPEDLFESPTTLSNVQSASTPKLAERKLTNEESKAKAASLIKWD